MSTTLATVAGILKEVYEGDVRDQTQSSAVTLKRITKSSDGIFDTPGGKYVVFPVRKNRNHGISYRAENTQLAAARRQGYAQATETLRYGYGRIRLTGQVMELAKTNAQAFMSAVDGEVENLKLDLTRDSNRIAVGNRVAFAATGATGIITRSSAISSGATITVTDTSQIEVDMFIDFVDNSGVAVSGGTGKTVLSVTNSTTFVVDASVAGVIVGTNIVRSGNYNQEPYGILNLIGNTGTVHGINSATAGNEYWRSEVDSTTTTLTEASMITRCDAVRKATGKYVSAVFSSLGCRRSYFNLLTSMRRYNEPKEFAGGLIGLAFNYEKEIPVVTDIDFPLNTMAYLVESEITVYRNKEWYWADDDGSMLKYVHDYDAWEALMKQYWQIVVHQRNAFSLQTNITES